jgi:hypothetical protein
MTHVEIVYVGSGSRITDNVAHAGTNVANPVLKNSCRLWYIKRSLAVVQTSCDFYGAEMLFAASKSYLHKAHFRS